MTPHNWNWSALLYVIVLFVVLGSTPASAYQFGAPPITEIADDGQDQGRFTLFNRTETINQSSTPTQTMGLEGVSKTGDRTGAKSFMYRLSTFSYEAPALTNKGTRLGIGGGWEWNLLSDRSLGLLANLQFDYESWSYSERTQNYGSGYTYGAEIGALYRIFIDRATITPFVMLNKTSASQTVNYWQTGTFISTYSSYDLSESGNSTSFGVDFMFGKTSLTILKTTGNSTSSSSLSSQTFTNSNSGTMFSLGYNF